MRGLREPTHHDHQGGDGEAGVAVSKHVFADTLGQKHVDQGADGSAKRREWCRSPSTKNSLLAAPHRFFRFNLL